MTAIILFDEYPIRPRGRVAGAERIGVLPELTAGVSNGPGGLCDGVRT